MKKFLLSSAFVMLVMGSFAQNCPTSAKRNNGNGNSRCNPFGGVGGTLTISFPIAPDPNLQLFQIINSETGATSTIVEASKLGGLKPNGAYEVEWCFETDNAGALTQGGIQYTFYIDVAPFNEYNGEPVTLCTQASLPVTLVNFNAVQRTNKVTLTWETLFELNNDGFEIERRIGSGAYQKIAFVDSKAPGGNGDAFSYSFEDATNLPKGVTYYRLRQVDFDGRATFSEIKAVRTGNGTIVLSVYPNPSRGTTNVALPSGVGTYDVSLDDFTGKSVQRFSGLTTTNLQLNNLKPGMYMLRVSIRATGETITERIAVQ
jgi:hypothetical protein